MGLPISCSSTMTRAANALRVEVGILRIVQTAMVSTTPTHNCVSWLSGKVKQDSPIRAPVIFALIRAIGSEMELSQSGANTNKRLTIDQER